MKRQIKKWVTVFSMLLIVLSTILPSIALAEDSSTLADGEYTIDFTFLKDGTDETSVMDDYTEKPATLLVDDGEYELHLTLTNSEWIKEFKVEQDGDYADADVIKSDTDADTRVVGFPVADLDEKINAFTHVVVTGVPEIPGYDHEYEVQIQLHPDSLDPLVDPSDPGEGSPGTPGEPSDPGEGDPGTPGEPSDPGEGDPSTPGEPSDPGEGDPSTPGEPSDPGEGDPGTPGEPSDPGEGDPGTPADPEEPADPAIADGEYTIDFTFLKDGTDETSVMDGYTEKPATLLVDDGEYELHLTFTNSEWIKEFKVEQDGDYVDAEVIENDTANNKRIVGFPVADLNEKINAFTHVVVTGVPGLPGYDHEYEVQIQLHPDSLDPPSGPTEPGDGGEPGTPGEPTDPGEGEPEDTELPQLEDGAYTVAYAAIRADNDDPSSMDGRFTKPATLLVENGKYYVSFALADTEYITELELQDPDGQWVEFSTKDYEIEEFEIASLADMIDAKVSMRVPMGETVYENTQPFRIAFDPSTVKLADGTYDINYTAIRDDNDTPSSMDSRFAKPATLLVEEGNYYVSFVLANAEYVTGLELQQTDGTWVDFSDNDYQVEEFEIASLSEVIDAKVSMRVPMGGGAVYENTQPFRIAFDQAGIVPRISLALGADGSASFDDTIKDTRFDTSYGGTPFSIIVPAGSNSLSITDLEFQANEMLIEISVGGLGTREVTLILPKPTGLEPEEVGAFHQKGSIWEYREARVDGGHVYVQTNLSAVKLGKKVNVPAGLAGDASGNRVTLQWDAVAGATYELKRIEGGTETVIDNITAETYSENLSYSSSYSYQVRAVEAGHQSAWSPATTVTTEAAPSSGGGGGSDQSDGEYTINYRVLKDGTNETSIMQDYTVRPAKLTEQNGRQYITITLKNSSWIPVFRVTKNGGSASVVSRNNSADTRDVRFEVYDLSKDVDVYTEVDVPALNYSGKYDVQFRFDESSMKRGFTQKPVTSNPLPNESDTSKTEIKADKGGTIKFNGAEIRIPKDAFGRDLVISVEKVTRRSNLPLPAQMKFVSDVLEITKDRSGNFSKEVTIAIPYDKKEVDFDKADLAIYWLNERTDEWIKLDNVRIDRQKGIVSGDVDHFTKFAVLATEKQVDEEQEEETEQPQPPQQPGQSVELADIRGHWAEEAIRTLVEAGAVQGYGNGEFRPNNTVTRAEFAKILVEAFDLTADTEVIFPDTAQHWAREAVAVAAGAGIVTGYSEARFGPNDRITREQMAVMIARTLNVNAEQAALNFVDAGQIALWAKEAVATAESHQIIQGYPNNRFAPKGQATRAEAVTVIVKALQLEDDSTPSDPEQPGESEEPAEPEQPGEPVESDFADGEYEIGFTFFKDGTNEVSVMDDYTEKPATLFVEDGKYELHLTLTNSSWTREFKVEQDGAYVDARVVTSDSQADTRVVAFPVADLDEKINVFTHVIVTGIPGFNYDNEYTVQLELDRDSVDPVS
ncbi:NEAT domain-containing protein [Alkalihalobacillus oceani]|uniref:NEAT domain-containing protein n=1 Tax=Halalkalibacter oceani TaxID=1653776 RepID=A0A9X2DPH5_9BACI|nr:NEAT domain-containing protein [Halalkalibacter oceani]